MTVGGSIIWKRFILNSILGEPAFMPQHATLMNVVAIGYGHKSRSTIVSKSLITGMWNQVWSWTKCLPKGNSSSCMLRAECGCLGFQQRAGLAGSGRVICWLCILTCWHRVALCWGCSSRLPQGWSCNAATLICWRRADARRTRWRGPLRRGTKHRTQELTVINL